MAINRDDVNPMDLHPDIPGPALVLYDGHPPVSALWTGAGWVHGDTRAPIPEGSMGWAEHGPSLYGPGATPLRR